MQVERHFPTALAANADTGEFGGDHLGVVDHQHIAGSQDIEEIAHLTVSQPTAGLHDQHFGRVARLGRMKRDALLRQVEIELINTHLRLNRAFGILEDDPVSVRIFKGAAKPVPIGIFRSNRYNAGAPHAIQCRLPVLGVRQVEDQQASRDGAGATRWPRWRVNSR